MLRTSSVTRWQNSRRLPAQEIGADRCQIGKKVQAEITQIPDDQVAFLNPGGQILGKALVTVCTLADGHIFGLFAFDVVAVIHFDARSAGIAAAAFKRVGHFFVYL